MTTETQNMTAPLARESMDAAAFNAMMQRGFEQAKADESRPVGDVFAELKQDT